MSLKSNPVLTPPKWTYEDFYKAILDLQGRVKSMENKLLEFECGITQHRKALSDASQALEKALTEGPVPWTNRESETWEAFFSEQERQRMEKFKASRRPNPLNNLNGVPY